jgi:thiol-disulfide isomerase/thioredoxin
MGGRQAWWAALAAAALWATTGAAAGAVDIGDTAPALVIGQWIKGQPVTLKEGLGKTIFVVEFWATWCGPCKTSIPHLTKLQKQYAGQNVVIIGISDEPVETVKPFVADQKRMEYRVACDDEEKTSKTWRAPQSGIPQAFLVNQRGVVAWVGHPMTLDRPLRRAVAGTLSPQVELAKRNAKQQAMAAAQQNDLKGAIVGIDRFIALDKADPEGYRLKVYVLEATGQRLLASAVRLEMEKAFPDDSEILNDLAMHYAAGRDLAQRDPARAFRLARKAVALTQEKDAAILDTLATAYYAACDIDQAIEWQRKAVAAAEEGDREQIEATLAYYLKVQEFRAAPTP